MEKMAQTAKATGEKFSYADTVPKPTRKMGDGLETHGLPTDIFYGSPRMEVLLP